MGVTIERTGFSGMTMPEIMTGTAYMEEALAHTYIITPPEGVTYTGKVLAHVLRADDTAIAVDGTIDAQGRAVVTLIADCYHVAGRLQVAIYLTASDDSGVPSECIYACVTAIYRTVGSVELDSGSEIPTLAQLEAAYQACVTATADARAAADNAVIYSAAQTLTPPEQVQARENIGAADAEDFDAVAYPLDVEMLTIAGEAVRVLSGGISVTGGDLSSTTRARTQYFRVQPGNRYLFSLNDAEFVVISAWEYTSTSVGSAIGRVSPSGYTTSRFAFTASGNFVRIAFAHADTTVAITDDDKDAILAALSLRSVDGGQIPISSATPVIVAQQGAAYICGTVTELTFTPSSSGLCEVVFTTGSNPTEPVLPSTVRMPDWWTGVEANRTYDLMILNGTLAGVMSWAT
jgi:hypothetical protein